ncbi:hypothetical protein DFH06DRAFT_723705 [Mycena polygramma]|nr:hypothetical protein DFH06DRAFT_723705 [Mycena polygramma]
MDSVPSELIDSIFLQVPDIETLKECALVASRFREPSQRILLRSVSLGGTHHSYRYVWDIIQQSPHIATYVRTLKLDIRRDKASPEWLLPELLDKFTNVTQLHLSKDTAGYTRARLEPVIADAIVALIRRPTLEGFHTYDMERLPISLVAVIFFSVTSASFLSGSVDHQNPTASIASPAIPTDVENLVLSDCFTRLRDVLASAEFLPRIANLRRLWTSPCAHSSAIINAAAQKLEELCVDCTDSPYAQGPDAPQLHNFPSLRFFSITLKCDDFDEPWVVSALCSVLLSRAEEIIITQCSFGIPAISSTTMNSLNRVLSGRRVFPRIRWRLHSRNMDDAEALLRDFTAVIEEGIPTAHEREMLAVELLSGDYTALTWPGGTPMRISGHGVYLPLASP